MLPGGCLVVCIFSLILDTSVSFLSASSFFCTGFMSASFAFIKSWDAPLVAVLGCVRCCGPVVLGQPSLRVRLVSRSQASVLTKLQARRSLKFQLVRRDVTRYRRTTTLTIMAGYVLLLGTAGSPSSASTPSSSPKLNSLTFLNASSVRQPEVTRTKVGS